MSGLVNKVKDALTGEKNTPAAHAANQGASDYSTSTGPISGTHHGSTTSGTGLTSTTGAPHHAPTNEQGYGSTNAGPHSSNLANKADPRVDSDLDGRGLTGTGHGSTGFSSGTSTGTGIGSTGQGYSANTARPHSSNMANKADPRVDSDLGGVSGTTGGMTTGVVGGGHHTHGHGHAHEDMVHGGAHHSQTANRLDPHVSSGSRGSGLSSSTTEGSYGSSNTGPTTGATTGDSITSSGNTTAGPHKSALLNKLDPRVDSDLDGSKTIGGNKTFAGSTTTGTSGTSTHGSTSHGHTGLASSSNAPLDASTHTPSQFANAGHETIIAHDDVGHNYAGRHGSKVGDDLKKYGGGHV